MDLIGKMNNIDLKFIFLALILIASPYSYAGTITDVEDVDSFTSSGWKGYSTSWTHDLADQDFTEGTALSGSLAIDFGESYSQSGPTLTVVGYFDFQDDSFLFSPTDQLSVNLGKNSLFSLNLTKELDVTIYTTLGSLDILSSVLTITTSEPTTGTPNVLVSEPSSLALLAFGFVGLAFCRRKIRLG